MIWFLRVTAAALTTVLTSSLIRLVVEAMRLGSPLHDGWQKAWFVIQASIFATSLFVIAKATAGARPAWRLVSYSVICIFSTAAIAIAAGGISKTPQGEQVRAADANARAAIVVEREIQSIDYMECMAASGKRGSYGFEVGESKRVPKKDSVLGDAAPGLILYACANGDGIDFNAENDPELPNFRAPRKSLQSACERTDRVELKGAWSKQGQSGRAVWVDCSKLRAFLASYPKK